MLKTRILTECNYKAIFHNGKTIRLSLDKTKPVKELTYPEFYDIKITNKCFGGCEYCYQNSTSDEEHYTGIIEKVKSFFGAMNENDRPFQVACLDGTTKVFTPNGTKNISEIKIGDYILDEIGNSVKVVNTTKTTKDTICLIGTKGFKLICSKDHLFQSEGKLIKAEDLLNCKLDTAYFKDKKEKIDIDLSKFINNSSRKSNKRGGSSGGIVKDNFVAFMHTLTPIPRYLTIDEDIMWLYGISVAEGSRRGLSLNIKETDIANKALSIYSKITNLNPGVTRKVHSSAISVEFTESKTYRTIFFEALGIGKRAKNKSIKFLYNVSNNLLRSAFKGMFDGDGCYRTRVDQRNNKKYYSLSYKTASKTLANELVHLLYTRLDVKASLHSGYNKNRPINNRPLPKTRYYKIDIYGKDNIDKLFPEIFKNEDNYKNNSDLLHRYQNFIKVTKILPFVKNRTVYDITLEENSSHLFTTSHGVITHNCGGGEPTSHPDFLKLLSLFHELGIVPNYTTNGMIIANKKKCDQLIQATKKYCGGVALSAHSHLNDYWIAMLDLLHKENIKTNLHVIISDKRSIDRFMTIFKWFKDQVSYFVLLPLENTGRAESLNKNKDFDYLFRRLKSLKELDQISYGANFYNELKKYDWLDVSLYEPEMFSKYLDLKDMSLYKSSFNLEKATII